MFQEVERLIEDLTHTIVLVRSLIGKAGTYLQAVALAECYNELIRYADERTQSHPEVQRIPELRLLLLAHFLENADRHIDVKGKRIFSAPLLGGPSTLREWQEAGYSTRRTSGNYTNRLRYWQAIYDDAPLIFQKRVSNPEDIFNTSGTAYQSTFLVPAKRLDNTPKVKKPSKRILSDTGVAFAPITYEEVIERRNRRYSATSELVPWWQALNYGTKGGYPSVPGLHFVEDAERLVPDKINEYSTYLEDFAGYLFDLDHSDALSDIDVVENWLLRRIRPSSPYIDSLDLARVITFGVPF